MANIAALIFSFITSVIHAFGWRDLLDVLIVAILVYLILVFIKRSRSFYVLNAFIFILIISYLSKVLDLSLTRQLFAPLITFFMLIFVVVFQREIRQFFEWFSFSGQNLRFLRNLSISDEVSGTLVRALKTMAEERIGAIIVLPGAYPLDGVIEGGFPLGGKVSLPLLLSIFDDHSPGHDGAVIIKDNDIQQFGVHLPLAEHYHHFSSFGTRHRAAVGITEHTDALAIVVSEEHGTISLAENGTLRAASDTEMLEETIQGFLKENIVTSKHSIWYYIFINDFWFKLLAVVLTLVLWFFFVFPSHLK